MFPDWALGASRFNSIHELFIVHRMVVAGRWCWQARGLPGCCCRTGSGSYSPPPPRSRGGEGIAKGESATRFEARPSPVARDPAPADPRARAGVAGPAAYPWGDPRDSLPSPRPDTGSRSLSSASFTQTIRKANPTQMQCPHFIACSVLVLIRLHLEKRFY